MRISNGHVIELEGRRVEYWVMSSRSARSLRVRVGPCGVEVIKPMNRAAGDVRAFLVKRAPWILAQLQRVEGLRAVRFSERLTGEILFRGEPRRIRVETPPTRARGNTIAIVDGEIVIRRGAGPSRPLSRSLEKWLRKQARQAIEEQLGAITARLRQQPGRVYVMGQRTKWGNCSAKRNLSFNWRLILAPDFVLRYLVTHEAVHLVVPDHSARFWLAVQSLCPEMERAKQWLSAHHRQLVADLELVICGYEEEAPPANP